MKKEHWENVFTTKTETEVSWYQKEPKTSIELIAQLNLPKDAKIIDVGGGDSYLIDSLLELGYQNLYLLDISSKAIERIQARLGAKAEQVTFIVSDVLDFKPKINFDVWHDRASFHFLTAASDLQQYANLVAESLTPKGKLIVGTFSENGPLKCSGLPITQYSESKMKAVFSSGFEQISCITEDHATPFNTLQNFIFCTFQKN